jgi:hypothetical protein
MSHGIYHQLVSLIDEMAITWLRIRYQVDQEFVSLAEYRQSRLRRSPNR